MVEHNVGNADCEDCGEEFARDDLVIKPAGNGFYDRICSACDEKRWRKRMAALGDGENPCA